MNFWSCQTLMKSWPEIREKDTSEVYCSTLATIHQPDCGIALSYEEFEACRREEAAFAQSGAEYTSSQCGYQARDPYTTASPLPGHPPPRRLISDSERSNAGFSPYWLAAGVKCQQDLRWEPDATRAVSPSSRTNDLATRRPDPRARDRQDPRVSQSRENASGSRYPYSSGYTAGYGYPQYTNTSPPPTMPTALSSQDQFLALHVKSRQERATALPHTAHIVQREPQQSTRATRARPSTIPL